MKFVILLDIFFELLAKRKITASYLAQKYEVSVRTVYRYVDILSMTVELLPMFFLKKIPALPACW